MRAAFEARSCPERHGRGYADPGRPHGRAFGVVLFGDFSPGLPAKAPHRACAELMTETRSRSETFSSSMPNSARLSSHFSDASRRSSSDVAAHHRAANGSDELNPAERPTG